MAWRDLGLASVGVLVLSVLWTGCGGTSNQTGGAGTTGAAGTAGSAGTTGVAGTVGTAGSTGVAGTGGSAATAGSGGSAGTGGSAGSGGSAGTGGVAGTAGVSGTAGTAGSTGGAGTGGSAATAGSGGSAGTGGVAGTAGVSGTAGVGGAGGMIAPPSCLADLFAGCATDTCVGQGQDAGTQCYASGAKARPVPSTTCSLPGGQVTTVTKPDGSLCYTVEQCCEYGPCETLDYTWKNAAGVQVATGRWMAHPIGLSGASATCTATNDARTYSSGGGPQNWIAGSCQSGACP